MILRPCQSTWQSDAESDIRLRCSSSSQSETVEPDERMLFGAFTGDELVGTAHRGITLLWLTTHDRTPACAFYERLGYERLGVMPAYSRRPSGELWPSAFYLQDARRLTSQTCYGNIAAMRYMLGREAGAMTDDPEHVRRLNRWIIAGVVVVVFATVVTLLDLAPRLLVP